MLFSLKCDLQKHNHIILNTIYNHRGKSHDDNRLFYHNAIEMLLLTDKVNLKYYVLYQTKELLPITNKHFTIINILMFIISIAIVIIIIIIIIIIIVIIVIIYIRPVKKIQVIFIQFHTSKFFSRFTIPSLETVSTTSYHLTTTLSQLYKRFWSDTSGTIEDTESTSFQIKTKELSSYT